MNWKWIDRILAPNDGFTPADWLNELYKKYYVVDNSVRIVSISPESLYVTVRVGPKGVEGMMNAVTYEVRPEILSVEA